MLSFYRLVTEGSIKINLTSQDQNLTSFQTFCTANVDDMAVNRLKDGKCKIARGRAKGLWSICSNNWHFFGSTRGSGRHFLSEESLIYLSGFVRQYIKHTSSRVVPWRRQPRLLGTQCILDWRQQPGPLAPHVSHNTTAFCQGGIRGGRMEESA